MAKMDMIARMLRLEKANDQRNESGEISSMLPNAIGPATPPTSPMKACMAIVDPSRKGLVSSVIPVE